jgi:hypothetical protein
MFGFPVNLQDSGVQKFTNDADSGFPKIQQREIFYSVRDGAWSNINIWQTASGKVGIYPTRNDDVYIRHNVDIDPYPLSLIGRNLETFNLIVTNEGRIYGGASSGYPVTIFGDFKCYGTFAFTQTGGVSLYGRNNFINKNKQETKLYAEYRFLGDQPIMDAIYGTINITNGSGLKYSTSDLVVDSFISANSSSCAFYLKNPHTFICNGIFNVHFFYSDTESSLTFKGTTSSLYLFFCSRNPTIEFQNNIAMNRGNYAGATINGMFFNNANFVLPFPNGAGQSMYLGNGLVKFTTNNITINSTGDIFYDNTFLIDPNIVVTNNTGHTMVLNNTINGSSGTSQLINKGTINFNTLTSVSSMSTGIFDFTTFTNTIGYTGNYTATIPSYFTTFHNLTISGTGTKSLGVNTTLNGNLIVSNGTFELVTYNLSVNGTSTINGGYLKKSNSGNILFVGVLNVSSGFANAVDFTIGNPNVECRGGITLGLNISNTYQINGGNGTWNFTTNNQSVLGNQGVSWMQLYNAVIADNITLTIATTNNVMLQINNSINGATSTSKLLGGTNGRIALNSNIQPMTTGIWDFTTNVCFVRYMSTTNQTIWHSTYSHLELENNSTKTLSTNTTINNTLSCLTNNINSIFELSNYNLSVNGTSSLLGKIQKSGPGNILFVGLVTWNDLVGGIDFSVGNPTIETRNGFRYVNGSFNVTMNLGSSIWNFTTNNQSLYGTAVGTYGNFSGGQFNIANDIVLTIGSLLELNGSINGSNANSKLLMATSTSLLYKNATQPMATGILDTSTNLNTFIYGNSNQDIKGGPTTLAKQVYRNLTLNGGGTKTLQGYVSVLNTYTLTSPATLNNNGFTLTNP